MRLPLPLKMIKNPRSLLGQAQDEAYLDALSDDLVGAVWETMQPAHVSLWLRSETAAKKDQAPG